MKLDKYQKRIILSRATRILLIGGPGTAKTSIVAPYAIRMARELINGDIEWVNDSAKVLTFSYTNSAADNLKKRIHSLTTDEDIRDRIVCGTIHSFALKMLCKYDPMFTSPGTTLVDSDYDEDIIKDLIEDDMPDDFVEVVLDIYSHRIRTGRSLHSILKTEYPEYLRYRRKMVDIVKTVNETKRVEHLITFNDMLYSFYGLLLDDETRDEINVEHPVIIVDEFQDTNDIQWEIIKKLAGPQSYLLAAGDDAQTIFLWAGASFDRFSDFEGCFTGCKTYHLYWNYRCSNEIAWLSNALIAQSKFVTKKVTKAKAKHSLPCVVLSPYKEDLSEYITDEIERLVEEQSLDDICVLYRFHKDSLDVDDSAALRHHLSKKGIPYRVFGKRDKGDKPMVRIIFSVIKIIEGYAIADDWRTVLLEVEGVGKKKAEQIILWIQQKGRNTNVYPRSYKFTEPLEQLLDSLDEIKRAKMSAHNRMQKIIDLVNGLPKVNKIPNASVLSSLLVFAHQSESLSTMIDKYYDHSYPMYYPGEGGPPYPDSYLTLSTVHRAKSGEYHTVFFLGTDDEPFIRHRSFTKPEEKEEELLVMNVAVTRAERGIHVLFPIDYDTWNANGDHPNPWSFIRKIYSRYYKLVIL